MRGHRLRGFVQGICVHRLSASATVENAVLIPLATIVILACLKMNITAYNCVAAESSGMRGALKVGQEDLSEEELQTLEGSISEAVNRSLLMLPEAQIEVFQDSREAGVQIQASDTWRIPYLNDLTELNRTECFSSRSPADFVRLVHTLSKQFDEVSGDDDNGVHD